MEKRELICIGCPLGCPVTVSMEEGRVLGSGSHQELLDCCSVYREIAASQMGLGGEGCL